MLLGVALLDELDSGVPSAGAPAIQHSFSTSYATTAAVLLLAPALVALVLEPIVFLAADRWPRRWFVRGGLAAMAACSFAAALSPGPLWLAIAGSIGTVATGTAVTLAQATLVDLHPEARERVLTRWSLASLLGDLAGPLLLALVSWRAAYGIVGGLLALWSLLTMRHFPETNGSGEEKDESLFEAVKLALRDRRLLMWLAATALCDLLDETLVVFGSLHLRDDLGAGPTARAIALAAFVGGGAVGVVVADRLLARVPPMRLLLLTSLACAAVYVAWLAAPTWWIAAGGMALVGATAAPLYPFAQAQAYAALPGRSGAVNAAAHLFTPIGLALPFLLGALADRAGTLAALGVLVLEPLGIALVAVRSGPDRAS